LVVGTTLLLLGGSLVFMDKMNIGQFVAAEIIVLLTINSVEKLFTTIDVIYDVLTALDKIGHISDLKLDEDTGEYQVKSDKGLSIRAEKITFHFENEIPIFSELSFHIMSNEKVILKGSSGSGKTLLLQIIAGIHNISSGHLHINEVPIKNYKRKSLHESIAIGLNTNQLFEASILDNITMGREFDATLLSELLELLNLNTYLMQQSLHLESIIDSGGRRLPQSIIQKIQLARLLIGKPQLLLLEDPFHSIGLDEKKRIIDYITDNRRNCTLVVISDFEYWQEKCPKVLEIIPFAQTI
jgi:ABC-type bacteriocin/lantibiotic exporter with double-glycine peptidase domain